VLIISNIGKYNKGEFELVKAKSKGRFKDVKEIKETNELKAIMGSNLRSRREAVGITIEQLSEILNNTPGFIGSIETGRRGITPVNQRKLANLFKISIDDLFKEGNEHKSAKLKEPGTEAILEKIRILLMSLDKKQLKFIVSTIDNVKKLGSSVDDELEQEDMDELCATREHKKMAKFSKYEKDKKK
jgi:transcriptional regulator with XRE-family HTH domain